MAGRGVSQRFLSPSSLRLGFSLREQKELATLAGCALELCLVLLLPCCWPLAALANPVSSSTLVCHLLVLLLFFGRSGKPCVLLLFPKQFTLSLSSPGFCPLCWPRRVVWVLLGGALFGSVCPACPPSRPFYHHFFWALLPAWPRRLFFLHGLVQVCLRVALNAMVMQYLKNDIILGFSHDIYPFVFHA